MRYSIIAFIVAWLTACGSPCPQQVPAIPSTRIIDTACSWVKPITASPDDTLETKKQILAHDLAVQKNCPTVTPR